MFLLDAAAILLGLTAIFGLFNHHVLKLPFTIDLLVSGLLASFGVLAVDLLWPGLELASTVRAAVLQVDFANAVLSGMLSILLFAGALHTDLSMLRERALPFFVLATFGVLISTAVAAGLAFFVFRLAGIDLPVGCCLASSQAGLASTRCAASGTSRTSRSSSPSRWCSASGSSAAACMSRRRSPRWSPASSWATSAASTR